MNTNLIECTDCGKEISRRAEKCIHCGAPSPLISLYQEEDREITKKENTRSLTALKWGIPIVTIYYFLRMINIFHSINGPDAGVLDWIAGAVSSIALLMTSFALVGLIFNFFKKP